MFPRPSHRRRSNRRLPSAVFAVLALLLAVPAIRGAVEGAGEAEPTPWPGGRIELRASFGACHEGGGTNCVVDGDTVWIAGEKVRIAGIDAPETHEPQCAEEAELGRRSADRLRALLNSGTVLATRAGRARDPNGRLLRNVAVDGRDVGRSLVREGLARDYAGGKRGWC